MTAHSKWTQAGQAFGRLTTIRKIASPDRVRGVLWECSCSCGQICTVKSGNLTDGSTKSCGCLRRDLGAIKTLSHGHARREKWTPEYRCWRSLFDRCDRPSSTRYADYGGRGIRVCERWSAAFENFFADMGPKPTPKHTIDRIDNDGNYEPGNCRWATAREQRMNQRPRRYRRHLIAS